MRASLLLLAPLAVTLAACSGTAVGTGTGTGGSSGTSSSSGGTTGFNDGTTASSDSGASGGNGTTGPSAYDPLFDAPGSSSVTNDLLTGLWAGSTNYADVRIQLAASKITIALRCGNDPAVGLDVSAVVSGSSIRVLASKLEGQEFSSCGIKVTPQSIPGCTTADQIGCFEIYGTTLRFQGVSLFTSAGYAPSDTFTKLSD